MIGEDHKRQPFFIFSNTPKERKIPDITNVKLSAFRIRQRNDCFRYTLWEFSRLLVQFLNLSIHILSHASFSPFSSFSLINKSSEKEKVKFSLPTPETLSVRSFGRDLIGHTVTNTQSVYGLRFCYVLNPLEKHIFIILMQPAPFKLQTGNGHCP